MQILRTGFFHADPHPGNLAIDLDESLIYYDFGMMGEIKSFTRERLLDLFYAIYEKDANKVCYYLFHVLYGSFSEKWKLLSCNLPFDYSSWNNTEKEDISLYCIVH